MATCSLKTPLGHMAVEYNEAGVTCVREIEDLELLSTQEPDDYLVFDLSGLSEFQRQVLEETCRIPRGEVRTYSELAAAVGNPDAVRAVASALARNPVPLLIPCHRVIRSDGDLGDYRFGREAKRIMLEADGFLRYA